MSSHHIETCTCAADCHVAAARRNTSNQAKVESENSFKRPCEDYESEMPSGLGSVCSCEQFRPLLTFPARTIVQQPPNQATKASGQASGLWSHRTSNPVAQRAASFSSDRPEDRRPREGRGVRRQVEEDRLRRLTNEDRKAVEAENLWRRGAPFGDYQESEKYPTCSWTDDGEDWDSLGVFDSELDRDLEALDRMIRQVEIGGPSNALWHDHTTPDAVSGMKKANSKKPATAQKVSRIPKLTRFFSSEKAANNTDEDFRRYTPPLLSFSSARYPSMFPTSSDRIEAAQIELEKADDELIKKESDLATASAKYGQASSKFYALLQEQHQKDAEDDDLYFSREQERRDAQEATSRRAKKSAGSSW